MWIQDGPVRNLLRRFAVDQRRKLYPAIRGQEESPRASSAASCRSLAKSQTVTPLLICESSGAMLFCPDLGEWQRNEISYAGGGYY